MSDLKPCPFCGGEATHDTDGSAIWVICKKCGARCTSSFFSGKKGVRIVDERWNRRVPSAQPQWISVTERLPEDQTYVLVSTLDNDVQEAHLDGEGRFRDCYGDKVKCVIAWMPLPEPYKGE